MTKFLITITFLVCQFGVVFSQENPDDLLKMLEEKPKKEYTTATFKTTRLINFHTVEVLSKRSLDFRISHRFGDFNSGAYNAWGIDGGANIRLALEYCHGSRLMFGLGRTSSKKIIDNHSVAEPQPESSLKIFAKKARFYKFVIQRTLKKVL